MDPLSTEVYRVSVGSGSGIDLIVGYNNMDRLAFGLLVNGTLRLIQVEEAHALLAMLQLSKTK